VDSSRTIAEKVRFTVTIERADSTRVQHPLCAKGHFEDGINSLHTEAAFYRHLRPRLDVRAPRAHYTGLDLEARRGLIVMDDIVALGGTIGSAHEPYTLDTCRDALGQLALLHASTWDDPGFDVDWLAPRIVAMADLFPRDRLQGLLDDGRGPDLPAALRRADLLHDAMHRTAERPFTCVVHGDTHSGNSYRDADGRSCWFDWQVTQRGHWSIDVAYHLGTVLTVEDRRHHEADLLRHYLDELARLGVDAPDFGQAWDLYTSGFAWGYFLWAITQISSREVVLIHVPRLGAALVDHDTYGRLGVT
jgi:aminoglycoside phosphotransferase (APT) family kinase protein